MASPTAALTQSRPDIASSFEEFDLEMDRMGYISHRVLPTIDVGAQAGRFGIIPVEQLLQNRDTKRAPGSAYSRSKWNFETTTYATEEHGHEEPVDDRESAMYANYFDAEQMAARRSLDVVMRNAEARVEAAVFNATTWAAATTGITHEWDDATNAVPITDVNTAVQAIWDACGLWANALIINRKVFKNLRLCDQIRDRITSDGAGSSELQADISADQIARALDLETILVGGMASNSAIEGAALSIAPVWSDEYAMVCRIPTTSDFREPCIGRTFHWAGDGSDYDGRIETYRDETVRADIVRARRDTDEKILYVAAGHLLSNVTT